MDMGGSVIDNVLSFGKKEMAANFSAVAQVEAYWEGLRDGRLMPSRAEIDPRGLEGALEYALMLELVAPGVARIRVAGMHMSDLLGMEVRGMPISAFFEPGDRKRLAEVVDNVVNRPQVAEFKLVSTGGLGRPAMDARLLLAPVSSDGHGRPRLLGCLQTKGTIGRVPRRFSIKDVHTRRIVAAAGTVDAIKQDALNDRLFGDGTRSLADKARMELAEDAATFEGADDQPKLKSERPHLRLVR